MLEANGEKNSVVIKVGMVGDSQIGKTSLMVKYVEGSFDEDYIQTLGGYRSQINVRMCLALLKHVFLHRRQFHGKDYLRTANHYHVFDMGFGRAERVRKHAASGLQ